MSAYMIIRVRILDREKFIQGYAPAASRLVEQFGGQYLLRAPNCEVLEGGSDANQSVVISKWPDRRAALDFWHSPEYQEVKKMRAGIAECEVILAATPNQADS